MRLAISVIFALASTQVAFAEGGYEEDEFCQEAVDLECKHSSVAVDVEVRDILQKLLFFETVYVDLDCYEPDSYDYQEIAEQLEDACEEASYGHPWVKKSFCGALAHDAAATAVKLADRSNPETAWIDEYDLVLENGKDLDIPIWVNSYDWPEEFEGEAELEHIIKKTALDCDIYAFAEVEGDLQKIVQPIVTDDAIYFDECKTVDELELLSIAELDCTPRFALPWDIDITVANLQVLKGDDPFEVASGGKF